MSTESPPPPLPTEPNTAIIHTDVSDVNKDSDNQQQQQQPTEQTVTIPMEAYRNLINGNALALKHAINTQDYFDRIISSLVNVQSFVMNLKDISKKSQLGSEDNGANNTQNQGKA